MHNKVSSKMIGLLSLTILCLNCFSLEVADIEKSVSVNYDPDWINKSRLALSITGSIYGKMNFNPSNDTSDALYLSLQSFDTFLPFIALQGFPYAYQDQISDFQAFIVSSISTSKKILDTFGIYEQNITAVIGNLSQSPCSDKFQKAASTIRAAYLNVYNLILYTPIGNVKKLKQDVLNSCSNQDMNCTQAISVLLSLLKGDSTIKQECDALKMLYDVGLTSQNSNLQYKGWRSQFLNSATYIFQLATLGVGIQSAVLQIQQNDPSAWIQAQNAYQLQMREALERIQMHYRLTINHASYNAQINLGKYVSGSNQIFSNNSFSNISLIVQNFLNMTAPQKQWFVQVYTPSDSSLIQTSKCWDCFYIFGVNGTYNIFVAGVDATSVSNDNVLNQDWITFERAKDYSNLQDFVDDAFRSSCLYGVTATSSSSSQSVQYPDKWSGYRVYSDKFTFILWALQGQCPGQAIIF